MAYQKTQAIFSRWVSIMLDYKKHTGSWAWILHRITGLGLTVYILVHIIALMTLLQGEAAFNEEMALFQTPIFLVFEWLLGAMVMFHALNGIRIALVDLANGARYHKQVLLFVYILAVIMVAGMAYLIFGHVNL
jgi:succinate dehydrogenase / fumarate reductase cytochrome b subunit